MITNTGGARDCLPPLWPLLSQSGLNMNLIWKKISKQLFHCYCHNEEFYKIFFPSKYCQFFWILYSAWRKINRIQVPQTLVYFCFTRLNIPMLQMLFVVEMVNQDLCKWCTTASFVDAVQWRHMLGGWQTWKHLKTLTFGSKVQFCSPSKISTILFCRYQAVSCARMILISRQQIGCP